MKEALIVVDMQRDFIDGVLGTKEAPLIVDNVAARIEKALAAGEAVYFTQDTHGGDYLSTPEGRKLPVPHCLKGSAGWEIVPQIAKYVPQAVRVIEKPAFGLQHELAEFAGYDRLTLIGLCTDICVVSNAILLKLYYMEKDIAVEAACCAGITPEAHEAALKVMRACQIEVL